MAERAGAQTGRQARAELSFELAGGAYAVTAARLALAELDSRLDPSLAFDVRLLVSELVTNSVEHGGAGPDDSIGLALEITDARVRVTVTDGGRGFSPPSASPPQGDDRGWGLFIVEQLADTWGVDDGVWFEIDRSRRRLD